MLSCHNDKQQDKQTEDNTAPYTSAQANETELATQDWLLWLSSPIKAHKPKEEHPLMQNYKHLKLRDDLPNCYLSKESSAEMENFLHIIPLFITHSMSSPCPFHFPMNQTVSRFWCNNNLERLYYRRDALLCINCLLTWLHGILGNPVIEKTNAEDESGAHTLTHHYCEWATQLRIA